MINRGSLWETFKQEYWNSRNRVYQIIIVNIGVYVFVNLVHMFLWLTHTKSDAVQSKFGVFLHWLCVPAGLEQLLYQPWSPISYMFLHEDFLHILFNMVAFYLFGSVFRDNLGNRKILPFYILGGLAGAFLYILSFNVFPVFEGSVHLAFALGASASVMAFVVAVPTLLPRHSFYLPFIGPIRIIYIAAALIIMDIVAIPLGDNAGGHIAHLGGAFFGFSYIKALQRGTDWTESLNRLFETIGGWFMKRGQPRVVHKRSSSGTASRTRPTPKRSNRPDQDKIDAILDKISKSGYDSLTSEEKEMLFRASNND